MMWTCEYPSNLNVSALKFQSRRNEGGNSDANEATSLAQDKLHRRKKRSRDSGQRECTGECASLGDDLILSRLSSLLVPHDARQTDRNLSTKKDEDSPVFTLIPGETAIVLPTALPHSGESSPSGKPVNALLSSIGIEEVEALDPSNGGPSAGQCQFACLASALSESFGIDHALCEGFRPDLELRQLAIHVIGLNADLYRDFLTVAGGRTRSQSYTAGMSVDMDAYIRNMSSPSCDGDAVTLQALCDALKITVRIIKPVDADSYDEESQRRRLFAASRTMVRRSSSVEESDNEEVAGITDDSCSVGSTSASTSTTSSSSDGSIISALSWSENPYPKSWRVHHSRRFPSSKHTGSRVKRLYVSQEIRPRPLPRVDSRICDIQNIVRGRLIWLSHLEGEAHYRFLRPLTTTPIKAPCSFCAMGPVNEEEAVVARQSKSLRHEQLRNSSNKDGYIRHFRSSSSTSPCAGIETVSFDRLKEICVRNPSLSPRCGLCLQGFFSPEKRSCQMVSPSCCHHEFCSGCLLSWARNVSNTCPSCECLFRSVVDPSDGRKVAAFSCDGNSSVISGDPPREGEDSCSVSSEEEDESTDEVYVEGRCSSMSLFPPPLPKSFQLQVENVVSTGSKITAELSPNALIRHLLHEVARNMAMPVDLCAEDGRVQFANENVDDISLLGFLQRLMPMSNGSSLLELLQADLLRALRLVLTPRDKPSPALSTFIFPSVEVFTQSMLLLDAVTESSGVSDTTITLQMIERSLDLPKLLLWYLSSPSLKCKSSGMQKFVQGLECANRVLSRWSKQFGFSCRDALTDSTPTSNSGNIHDSKSRKRSTGRGQSTIAKKQKIRLEQERRTPAKSKAYRPPPKNSQSGPQKKELAMPAPLLRRAAGKRKVRPVACTNISREQWGRRTYK